MVLKCLRCGVKAGSSLSNLKRNARYILVNSVQGQSTTSVNFEHYKIEKARYKNNGSAYPPVYVPKDVQSGWYDWWESKGYFQPMEKQETPFSIIMPPPNVTGTLHLGHALTCAVQDALVKWHQMRGIPVLWVPGTDHAGIATQVVVEKKMWQEKQITRHDIGREKFLQEVWKWKSEKEDVIFQQLRQLGVSADWNRHLFSMDPKQSRAVMEAFVLLFDAGLIYRANSLVNWSCTLRSAISDIEVDLKPVEGPTLLNVPGYEKPIEFGVLHDFAYKVDGEDSEIIVSTTRTETMVGDVAVAVHPKDERYSSLHGKYVWHPFRKQKLPIICDEFVDREFGSGAVKITPAHNMTDFEVAKRHNLQILPVINEEGKLINSGRFEGMDRFDARVAITSELEAMDLWRGRKDHSMQVPFCSRSGDVVEFLLKPQWFLKCQNMANHAIESVRKGELEIEPKRFEKVWFDWLENIRDWCISRQLWWGHQIPAYFCQTVDGERSTWVAARNVEEAKKKAVEKLGTGPDERVEIQQDADVLDTWFSSALFPFSVFGWPNQTKEFKEFYPLSLMETGHDILFFWVARMVMLGTHLTGQIPFKKIILHGIICDSHGRKMSKSLGNVICPEDVINGISLEDMNQNLVNAMKSGYLSNTEVEKMIETQAKLFPSGIPECGTDALRFALCSQNIKNHYITFDVHQCQLMRNFCNKIWQATKYVFKFIEKIPDLKFDLLTSSKQLTKYDQWILSRMSHMIIQVNLGFENCNFHIATEAIRIFLHNELCDVYLEVTKPLSKDPSSPEAKVAAQILFHCLESSIRVLTPFMPYLSEELYHLLPLVCGHEYKESILSTSYPESKEWASWRNPIIEAEIQKINDIIVTIRRLKALHVKSKGKPDVIIQIQGEPYVDEQHLSIIQNLSGCGDVSVEDGQSSVSKRQLVCDTVDHNCSVFLILQDVANASADEQMMKKVEKLVKELQRLQKVVSVPGFRTKAPENIQKKHAEKIEALQAELKKLKYVHDAATRLIS